MWDIIGPLVGLDSGSLRWVLWGAGGAVGGLILFPSWSPTTCLFTQTRAPPRFKYTAGLGGARPTDGGMDKDFSMEMKFFLEKCANINTHQPNSESMAEKFSISNFNEARCPAGVFEPKKLRQQKTSICSQGHTDPIIEPKIGFLIGKLIYWAKNLTYDHKILTSTLIYLYKYKC